MPELNTPAFSAAAGELEASVVAMSAAHGSAADLIDRDNVMVAPWSSFGSPHTRICRAKRPPSRGQGDGGTASERMTRKGGIFAYSPDDRTQEACTLGEIVDAVTVS
jgi:hypothetical protein